MTGTVRSSAELDIRRRRAHFRSWHRGTREMDLILGRFADLELSRLTLQELDQFEALLEVADTELFKWVTGEKPVLPAYDTPLFARIAKGSRAQQD
ncbi:antitoxin CptB [Mesorhizobium sp. J18]|uniref:FAD assembly factor SdhE n=1 Tax=Mesorhizobium sp. J18 TaxID=935263 RepID=UPI0011997048|nr:succinate dehydrogenase assembly factor 2 [Mesorhizobium sp. J18]TWG95499.1 antitoxin CptB [Mesorhizobium sp. J18]